MSSLPMEFFATYEQFLCGEIVVNLKTEEEFKKFIERCHDLRLHSIYWIEKYSFEAIHKDAGIQVIEYGDFCMEYSPAKGFTGTKSQSYKDWGSKIITLDEFLKATD